MQYRRFGSLEWKASALGFGVMRMPTVDGNPFGKIEEEEATRMLRHGIDQGINYVDTAYNYHSSSSEFFVGRALQDGYREKVKVATKMPCWLVESAEDFDRFLNEQLERLQTDIVDFYLLHALRREWWVKLRDLGVTDWAERAIEEGRIGHIGFSFHSEYEDFQQIIDEYEGWTFCQIMYNYMDEEYQAGTKGLEYAAEKGLAVVVMEPLRGGQLTKNVPQSIQEIWDRAPRKRSPADWALQWIWDHPQVSLLLSGMSTMQHVRENLISASQSGVGTLTEEERALVAEARDRYRELAPVRCTACRYCMPCPSDVNIPRVFEVYNDAFMYEDVERARRAYGFIKEEQQATACTECEQCVELCPQQLDVPQWLKTAHELLKKPEEV